MCIRDRPIVDGASWRNWFKTFCMVTTTQKMIFFCIVLCAAKCGQSRTYGQETNNAARNWHRQWTSTDLIWCHLPWSDWVVMVDMFSSDNQLRNLMSDTETEWERERERERDLWSECILSYRSRLCFAYIINASGLSNEGFICIKNMGFLRKFATPVIEWVNWRW